MLSAGEENFGLQSCTHLSPQKTAGLGRSILPAASGIMDYRISSMIKTIQV